MKQRTAGNTELCRTHHAEARSLDVEPRIFASQARRVLPAHHFTLEYCSETLRAEILYGLQRRDLAEFAVAPFLIRQLMPHIESCISLLDVDTSVLPHKAAQCVDNLRPYVAELHDRYTGTDVLAGDVWPPHAEFLFPSSQERRVVPRTGWDWCDVDCLWLRDLGKRYVADTLPRREDVTQYLRACKAASASLRATPAFDDRTQADLRHMTRIVKDLETVRGLSYTEATRMAGRLKQMLLHCRTSGYMAGIPEGFAFHPMHRMRKQNKTQPYEEPGDAIPEDVIAFLDDNLASFKPNFRSSHRADGWTNDDYGHLWQTIYKVLRDTGRRPYEATELRFNCLRDVDDEGGLLIWDNRKGKRLGRRLPIWRSTVDIILDWQEFLRSKVPNPDPSGPLFPMLTVRTTFTRPVTSGYFGQAFRKWTSSLDELPQLLARLDAAGDPFLDEQLVLYGFRHAYAQLAADAGIDPVILQELMDHRSLDTTTGYFHVSRKRKREAIEVLNKLRVDTHGRSRPVRDLEAYERTEVATILGGCVEPSNVKAGGRSCPIRFQCGACNHYRPDPTYIPEIEQEIKNLRAQIAIAELSATRPVVENLEYNVGMMQAVLRKMHEKLTTLTPEEQAIYETFHAEIRKSRRFLDLMVIDRRSQNA
ncbi:tyrosine-type recombinase/integrase [Knoellia sinensis]|uniref:tyrosine-type recombinase/integrase n=1 Tax=Knoellia sinensis TaxID=136100 RepID=UPI000A8A1938|nr:site-specific integrase [Knoellia sinensis]